MTDQPTADSELRCQLDAAIAALGRSETELARLRPALARVHHTADLIAAGAPWTANHAELAARIRDAASMEQQPGPDGTNTTEPASLRDEARGQVARVREAIVERRTKVAEREADGMLPLGTPGASWCDAVTVTCDRIEDALRIFPEPRSIPAEPAHDDGPSVAECRDSDRRWPLQKTGE